MLPLYRPTPMLRISLEAPAPWWGEERSGVSRIKQSGGLSEVTSAARVSATPGERRFGCQTGG
ncbi:hypothetical protein [Roseobacter sp. S98]|uniref:hypothetical protein n=1 Tax=Roseobacter algicola (ex Choi et al. 2025) (nom. illeg.) TaxID=3092138 RepID=UPI0035C681F2